jgi:RNA polymerase sigma factor (sigma-70 family)
MSNIFSHKTSPLSLQSDEDLAAFYKNSGEMNIIGELFRRYSHLVLGICFKYLQNTEEAKDAVMQIFEKLISDLKNNRIENFKSWLYVVSKNHCLMQIRKEVSEKTLLQNFSQKVMEIWDELHLNHEDDIEKRLALLMKAMKQLPHDQMICIELLFLQDKSYKEISEITGLNLNGIKSYVQNGKRNLKKVLEKTNGSE